MRFDQVFLITAAVASVGLVVFESVRRRYARQRLRDHQLVGAGAGWQHQGGMRPHWLPWRSEKPRHLG